MDDAAPNLHTVQGMVDATRALLLDKVTPYRYSDTAIIAGLNLSLLEGKRLRPDLFIGRYRTSVPQYEQPSGEEIPIEEQFRVAFMYGISAFVLLRDDEDVQDARAKTFMERFASILTGITQSPIQGGTPSAKQASSGGGPRQ